MKSRVCPRGGKWGSESILGNKSQGAERGRRNANNSSNNHLPYALAA